MARLTDDRNEVFRAKASITIDGRWQSVAFGPFLAQNAATAALNGLKRAIAEKRWLFRDIYLHKEAVFMDAYIERGEITWKKVETK